MLIVGVVSDETEAEEIEFMTKVLIVNQRIGFVVNEARNRGELPEIKENQMEPETIKEEKTKKEAFGQKLLFVETFVDNIKIKQ